MNPNDPNQPGYGSEMPEQPGGFPPPPPGGMPQGDYGMDSAVPNVAAAPGKALGVILGGVGVVAVLFYVMFGGEDEKKADVRDLSITQEKERSETAKVEVPPPAPVALPKVPEIQPVIPAPPAPPPAPPPPPVVPTALPANSAVNNKEQIRRYKSEMVVSSSSNLASGRDQKNQGVTGFNGSNSNLAFSRELLSGTKAEQAEATVMGDMNYIVAQGKVIDAILETAIDTDLPGPLRAIVARDIFAESGREVMIPKGSRLIGNYNSSIKRGQRRVYVIWTRIIRPDGIDIKVDSPGVDQLGRGGIEGYLDNKYYEMFASSLLTSSIAIGVGIAADSIMDDGSTSTTNTSDGTTTSSGSAGSQAVIQGVTDFSQTSQDILRGILDQPPTITVDQGTRVKVFVNRDLIMPPAVLEQTRFIQ